MADTDLAARIAETAAFIGEQLAADETAALAAGDSDEGRRWTEGIGGYPNLGYLVDDGWGRTVVCPSAPGEAQTCYIARNDPARALRRVKAVRDLTAEILAEPHLYVEGDPWFSCRQAVSDRDDPQPGSGCARDDAGGPCDCGRDERVARRLDIIAGEWREAE